MFRSVFNRTTGSIFRDFGSKPTKSNYQYDYIGLDLVFLVAPEGFAVPPTTIAIYRNPPEHKKTDQPDAVKAFSIRKNVPKAALTAKMADLYKNHGGVR